MKKIKLSIVILFTYIFLISLSSGSAQDLTPEQIYEKTNDCVVVILSYDFNGKQIKQGSGVVISEKGWVVTNYHVFAECEKMEVKHNDKIIKYTDIIGVDVEKDILILKIEDNSFPSIPIGNSDNLKVGQRVYAIGSPLGFENSLSEGIISGIRNIDIKNKNYIQITTSISPGSSGGAVVNSKGEIIGISTMTLNGGQNLNFAIPINDIMIVTLGSFSNKKYIDANNNFMKGYNALESGNYAEAIKYFTSYLNNFPNDAGAYFNRGLAFNNLQEYYKAIDDFNKAIDLKPNDADEYFNRGNAYYDLTEYLKSITDYTKAIELNPNNSDAYFNRGDAYFYSREYSKAIIDYSKAIELNPNDVEAYYKRGETYRFYLKDYSKAMLDFNKAIAINPNDDIAYSYRGTAYSILQDYPNVILDFTKAIEINPNEIKYYRSRGNAFNSLRDYYKALSDFNKSLSINPNDAFSYLFRGSVYYNLGNTNKACEDYRKAYSLGLESAKNSIEYHCK